VVAFICNPSTWEAVAKGLQFKASPGKVIEIFILKIQTKWPEE
jgi:hypothetical protein